MDSLITHKQEAILQQRLDEFLTTDVSGREAMREVIRHFGQCECQSYLFGGLLRDLMVKGKTARPRDVDVVVAGSSSTALEELFRPYLDRKTRFGGLHLKNKDWMFDVWPLEETWAFKHGSFKEVSFSELPRTAFLNVEAVVAELSVTPGATRKIYTLGFFEGITNKTIELNYEENPFPALCVVRSLVIATDLSFQIGPVLADYILRHMSLISVSRLMEAQIYHYGITKLSPNAIREAHKAILRQSQRTPNRPVTLPDRLHKPERPVATRTGLAKMQH